MLPVRTCSFVYMTDNSCRTKRQWCLDFMGIAGDCLKQHVDGEGYWLGQILAFSIHMSCGLGWRPTFIEKKKIYIYICDTRIDNNCQWGHWVWTTAVCEFKKPGLQELDCRLFCRTFTRLKIIKIGNWGLFFSATTIALFAIFLKKRGLLDVCTWEGVFLGQDIMFLNVASLIIRADGRDEGDALVLTTALRGRIF